MTKTKNDLPEKVRTEMIDLLNARLSDAIDLELQTKQAHWNVKGTNFIALHELSNHTLTARNRRVRSSGRWGVSAFGRSGGLPLLHYSAAPSLHDD